MRYESTFVRASATSPGVAGVVHPRPKSASAIEQRCPVRRDPGVIDPQPSPLHTGRYAAMSVLSTKSAEAPEAQRNNAR